MRLLREIHDTDIGETNDLTMKYGIRKAARCVLQRADGKIALLWVGNGNYHKLPGGGIEEGEEIMYALAREVEEEVGCSCVIGEEVGVILEYKKQHEEIQINYCFKAATKDVDFVPNFSEKEKNDGFSLKRYAIEEVIDALKHDTPTNYTGKFIQLRDITFLDASLKL